MRRHDKQHFANTEDQNYTTINNERGIGADSNSCQVTLKADQKGEKRRGGISKNRAAQCPVHCAAI
jgi:hypothetical protein